MNWVFVAFGQALLYLTKEENKEMRVTEDYQRNGGECWVDDVFTRQGIDKCIERE